MDGRPAPRHAVIYTRISRDKEGQSVGVQRQEVDCRALAEQRGLEVVRVYTDNDLGASSLSRKPRPAFDQMLRDIAAGGVDVVLAYSASRLTRRPMEFEGLLALHKETGLQFKTVVSGEDDLSTVDGVMAARIKASVDAAEAERTGERLKAAHRHMAQAGKPFLGGSRAFGWEADKITLRPDEADLIRKAVSSIVSGAGSLTGVAAAWNALGVRTTKGNEWRHMTVKGLLTSPRLAGYRTYKGAMLKGDDGKPVRGLWAPVLTDEERDRLLVALEDRKRTKRRATSHLLTPFLMCGRCGARMYGSRKDDGKSFYRCSRKWHLTANASQLERAVGNEVGIRLGKVYAYGKLHPERERLEGSGPRQFAGAERLDALQRQNEELMARYNLGLMKGERVFPQVEANDREIDGLLAEQRRWRVEQERANTPSLPFVDGFDLSLWWKLFNDEIRVTLTNIAVERIVVRPTGKGRALSVRERLDVQWTPAVTPWPEGEEPEPQPGDLLWLEKEAKEQAVERRSQRVSTNENEMAVVQLVKENPRITGQQIADTLGISRPYAQTLLRRVRNGEQSAAPAS